MKAKKASSFTFWKLNENMKLLANFGSHPHGYSHSILLRQGDVI